MKPYILKSVVAIILSFPLTGFANDTAGTTSAGGINFIKSPEISMEQEELTISPTRVYVKYHFKNISSQTVTREIYFPLPPYKMQGANAAWDEEIDPEAKTRNSIPFLNFTVRINGKKRGYQILTRAVIGNQDVTQQLQKAQLPLSPELVAGNMPLDDTEQKQQQQWLQKAKAIGLVNKQQPRWQKQIFYTWKQTFPANAVTIIEHEYRPAAGVFYSAVVPNQNLALRIAEDLQYFKTVFNIDIEHYRQLNPFKQWLTQRLRHMMDPHCKDCREDRIYALFFNVDYILKTGANWSGPIQNFILNIEYPINGIISYNCFYGKQKVIEKRYKGVTQLTLKHFIPQENLSIIFGLSDWPKDSE